MATTKEYHDYIIECLNKDGQVISKKMMGMLSPLSRHFFPKITN